jgi:hypothetical protein
VERVWFVSPAWGREEISELVFSQRRWLCEELGRMGLEAQVVIVADDANLDIAEDNGFHTVEMDNSALARRFNAGYAYAAAEGADWFVHVGSDDWMHPSIFEGLGQAGEHVLTRRQLSFVDMGRDRLVRCTSQGVYGTIPWIIPRALLAGSNFHPCPKPERMRGMDSAVASCIPRGAWVFQEGDGLELVDFKSETNINRYDQVSSALASRGEEDAWEALATRYPAPLVEMARSTARRLYDLP